MTTNSTMDVTKSVPISEFESCLFRIIESSESMEYEIIKYRNLSRSY